MGKEPLQSKLSLVKGKYRGREKVKGKSKKERETTWLLLEQWRMDDNMSHDTECVFLVEIKTIVLFEIM